MLQDLWRRLKSEPDGERCLVVCPSISMDPSELERLGMGAEFEERLLCLLLELRRPGTQVVFLASQPPCRESVDHYLDLLMSAGVWDARDRLHLFDAGDPGWRPLAQKLESQPELLERVRRALPHGHPAWLEVYRSGPTEERVARALGIPLMGSPPGTAALGTKSGSRRLFREVGLPHPPGVEGLRNEADVPLALADLRRRVPGLRRAILKLEDGFSGRGNAILDLRTGGPPRPVDPERTWEEFAQALRRQGGILEAMVEGVVGSPSVQLHLSPLGEVEITSTHEQILDGQRYLGCRMPGDPRWSGLLHDAGRRVGALMARHGVVGHLGMDFVATASGCLHAIEINLRKCGTTHPLLTLRGLTGGRYEPELGEFRLPSGEVRCYQATDKLPLRGCSAREALDRLVMGGLRFDPDQGRGVVLHMLGALQPLEMVGATCVDTTPQGAGRLFQDLSETLQGPRRRGSLPGPREIWSRRLAALGA